MAIDRVGIEHEPRREPLDSISVREYQDLPDSVLEWLESDEDVPSVMKEKLGALDPQLTLREALQRIREALLACSGGNRIQADSFEESRFTPFTDIVDRGLVSCGAHTRGIGTVLRHNGIPVRFVDGTHQEGENIHGHAWLDIYNPRTGDWIESDTRTEDFSFGSGNERKGVFHNWEELRATRRVSDTL